MRKFFTFVICAFCALSVWGTNPIQIGSGSSSDANSPISMGPAIYNSITQQLYLAEELDGAPSKTITAIGFYYTSTTEYTRTLEIYLSKTSEIQLSSSSGAGQWMYHESNNNSAGTLVFSGSYTLPNQAGWYSIELSTPFEWDGTSNIVVTVNDKSNAVTGNFKKHRCYTATKNRNIYKYSQASGTSFDGLDTYHIDGTATTSVPQIQFTFKEEGPTPVTTPTITVPASINFGTCYLDEADAIQTFSVKASDLTNDITLSTAAAGVTINPTSISKDNTALAGDGVEVTVTLGSEYTFPSQAPSITLASEGATSKTVTITATKGEYKSISMMSQLNTDGYFFLDFDANINSIDEANKTMEIKNVFTRNANYAKIADKEDFKVGGKLNGLKGKYESEVFTIFDYATYTAPAVGSVIEIDENEDNSDTWPEAAQSGKELLITRTIVPNEWNSIVLPTDLTSTEVTNNFGSGTDVEEFTGAVVSSSNITLNFTKKTDGIVAGVPYLIKPTQALPNNSLHLTNHSFTPTASTITNDGIEFVGVLVPTLMDATGDDFIFVGSGNTLLHPSSAGTIKGMRAYFHVVGEAAIAAIKKSPMISLSTDATTAMTLVKPANEKSFKAIENGRIVINVQGKKIDVLGQTVK